MVHCAYIILLIFSQLACDELVKSDNRSRPTDDQATIPDFEAYKEEKVKKGEEKVVTFKNSSVIFSADTLHTDVMIRVETRESIPDLVTADVLSNPLGDILQVTIFEEKTREIYSSDIIKQPFIITQNISEMADSSKLNFVVVTSPDRETEKVQIIGSEAIISDDELSLLNSNIKIAMVATHFVIFPVEIDELPDDIEKLSNASEIETSGDGEILDPGNSETSSPKATYSVTGKTTKIAAGHQHICIVTAAGEVKCWGDNFTGQLGVGHANNIGDGINEMGANLQSVPLGGDSSAVAVVAGNNHSCALNASNQVYCWGFAQKGALGQENETTIGDQPNEVSNLSPVNLGSNFEVTEIAAGAHHTCAISSQGKVKCWGYNYKGVLGLELPANVEIGDSANEMGENLPEVDLGTGQSAVQIASGEYHTCVILDGGKVKCWGQNYYGQCGQGHGDDIGDNSNEMGDNLPFVELGTGKVAVQLDVAQAHTCVLFKAGDIKCFGYNLSGVLGLGHAETIGDAPGEMGDNLPAADLGSGNLVKGIFTAGFASCAVLTNGGLKCWGVIGIHGTAGTELYIGDEASELGDNLPLMALGTGRTVTGGAGRSSHICAQLDDSSIKCWGDNTRGQLGQQHFDPIEGHDPSKMGDNLIPVSIE